MKAKQLLIIPCGLLAGLLALIAPQPAFAGGLHIHQVFKGGDPPPPSSIAGGGNLQAIFAAAAKNWERVCRDSPGTHITRPTAVMPDARVAKSHQRSGRACDRPIHIV